MAGQTVKVTFQSKIYQDGGDESYEVTASGQLVQKGAAWYLTYDEALPEQPVTKVLVKIEDDRVAITRSNVTKTRLVFEKGLVDNQPYQTAAGMFILATNTKDFLVSIDEVGKEGKVLLDYSLSANGRVVGQYQVSLHFVQ
ncbi:DUF1934 domain-containing protein [Fructobacillus sp. M1-13]|uniref:DUF1934 domain-containing protein n=1 Tax=Fructobacillus papyriferae TaxID=2713171 RepID=A0ABS5QQ78_9LACO|nr:DUF1934 domain-containing protein [Fructobacillus papyriferae]MBS9335077.1 DUF1934 domain-containing protein [Fructobacillus papyriferae]MCD2159437.1 DUF1934 domain-containing protein [Fructobacillus papyriferae]